MIARTSSHLQLHLRLFLLFSLITKPSFTMREAIPNTHIQMSAVLTARRHYQVVLDVSRNNSPCKDPEPLYGFYLLPTALCNGDIVCYVARHDPREHLATPILGMASYVRIIGLSRPMVSFYTCYLANPQHKHRPEPYTSQHY